MGVRVYARRIDPGRSCSNSNLDVSPGFFPVAVGFAAGLAFVSLARIARTFLLLFVPSFFFRFFWFGMVSPFLIFLQINFRFFGKIKFQFSDFLQVTSAKLLN